MDEIESMFRDGLRRAVADRSPLGPVDLDEVMSRGRSGGSRPARAPAPRWLAAVAAVVLVAGIAAGTAYWRTRPGAVPAMPVAPAISPTPANGATPASAELMASQWRAIQIQGSPVIATTERDVPSLEFTDSSASAYDGCNRMRSRYTLDGDVLTFQGWSSTEIGCASADVRQQAQRFDEAIAAATRPQISGDVLELLDRDGRVLMRLLDVRASTPEPTTSTINPPAPTDSASPTARAVQVRVRNDSGFDFADVEARFPDGTRVDYGPVRAGAESAYADAGRTVYSYAWMRISTAPGPPADGRVFTLQPADYVGERELVPGSYTYIVTLSGDQLVSENERDR